MDILLVDDDASVVKVLQRGLAQRGYQVRIATNGLEAFSTIEQQLPDMVISDVRMPEMDGLELLQFMRMRYPGVPCILMTGYDDGSTVPALQLGAYDYLHKPVQFRHLLECIERVRVRRKLEEQLIQEQSVRRGEVASAPTMPDLELERLSEAVAALGQYLEQLEQVWSGSDAAGSRAGPPQPPWADRARGLLSAIRDSLTAIHTVTGRLATPGNGRSGPTATTSPAQVGGIGS